MWEYLGKTLDHGVYALIWSFTFVIKLVPGTGIYYFTIFLLICFFLFGGKFLFKN